MTLTEMHRAIDRIQDLPVHRRAAAARGLIADLDAMPTGVTEETAIRLWMQLGRNGTGRRIDLAVRTLTAETARRVTVEALTGGDPIAAVREAWEADQAAQEAADRARRALMQAVGDGRRAGATIEELMAAAGRIARQTVYDWTEQTRPHNPTSPD